MDEVRRIRGQIDRYRSELKTLISGQVSIHTKSIGDESFRDVTQHHIELLSGIIDDYERILMQFKEPRGDQEAS